MRTAATGLGIAMALALTGCVPQATGGGDLLQQALGVGWPPTTATAARPMTTADIAGGLKEALRVGTERVVLQVGRTDGYNADPAIHIPLPDDLRQVHDVLSRIGLGQMTADLELRLNRAAERAAPEARDVFWQAIAEMTLDDVHGIWRGPDDAATQYFRGKMTGPLTRRMTPIVLDAMSDVGVVRAFDRMMDGYRDVPFVPDVKADLTAYAVERALDGMFHYIAQEEAAIRRNPAERTTELLQRVFGALTS